MFSSDSSSFQWPSTTYINNYIHHSITLFFWVVRESPAFDLVHFLFICLVQENIFVCFCVMYFSCWASRWCHSPVLMSNNCNNLSSLSLFSISKSLIVSHWALSLTVPVCPPRPVADESSHPHIPTDDIFVSRTMERMLLHARLLYIVDQRQQTNQKRNVQSETREWDHTKQSPSEVYYYYFFFSSIFSKSGPRGERI